MRDIKSLQDANVAIRELQDTVRNFTASVVDFKGRRIGNAGASISGSDYVIREELATLRNEFTIELSKVKTALDFLERRVKALEP